MSSTPSARLDSIRQIYFDALDNEMSDGNSASDQDKDKLHSNVLEARKTYFAAVASALAKTSTQVEAAYSVAVSTLDDVKKARATAAGIATVLQKLTTATSAATTLLNLAT